MKNDTKHTGKQPANSTTGKQPANSTTGKKNDNKTTSSPTPRKHDEQTGHDVLSQQAHVSGKEVVGEDTQTKTANHKAGIMTEETSISNAEPAAAPKLDAKATADRIAKLSKSGDPYEFDNEEEAKEVYGHLDPDMFIYRPGETKFIIQRV